jgi:uncharacterized RDD family membrane protein YckC
MLPEKRTFFIRGDDGEEYGPVDMAELREWVRENRAGLGTSVRLDETNSSWQPWQYYPELVALLAESHVTSPVPGQPGLVIAPLGRRIAAFLLDLFLSAVLSFPILFVLALIYMPDWCVQSALASIQPQLTAPPPLPLRDAIIVNVISDIVLAFYMAGFHAAHGQTPAKAILRVRVVNEDGKKPVFVKSFLRALVLVFSLSPYGLYGLFLIYAFFNPQRRTFHDFVAGTYVVEA